MALASCRGDGLMAKVSSKVVTASFAASRLLGCWKKSSPQTVRIPCIMCVQTGNKKRVNFCKKCHHFLTRRVRPYMARCLNACQEPDLRLIFRLINQWGLTLHGASRTSARNNHWVLPRGFTNVYRAARPFLRWPIRPQHGSRPGPVIRLAPVAPQLCDYKGVPSPSIFPEPTPTCSSL